VGLRPAHVSRRSSGITMLIVVRAVLGVPVAVVLIVLVVAVPAGLVPAGGGVHVRMLVLVHAVVGVVHHRGLLLYRLSRRPSEAHSPCQRRAASARFLLPRTSMS